MTAPTIAAALVDTLQAIKDRKGQMPSHAVQKRALQFMEASPTERRMSRNVARAIVYRFERDSGTYLVALYMTSDKDEVIDGECSCPAGQARTTCYHLLAALANAYRDGHRLVV